MRLSGGPNRAFPTARTAIQQPDSSGENTIRPLTVKFPSGDDLLAAGEQFDLETAITMKVVKVQADIPAGATGYIELDGQRIHSSDDNQGNVGSLEFGDMAAGIGLAVSRVVVRLRNNSSTQQNVRYWLVGFP